MPHLALFALRNQGKRAAFAVIPGRCAASSPESRDSGFGPSDRPGMTVKIKAAG
jgi:hypothetical protein